MSYITQQVVGTGYEPQTHFSASGAVLAIAEQIAEHLAKSEGEHWVNCEFSHDGKITSVITISNDLT